MNSDSGFWALAEQVNDGVTIRLGGGVETKVTILWDQAFADINFIVGSGFPFPALRDELVQVSMAWLILHELQHFELGHFDLIGRHAISETHYGKRFAIAARMPMDRSILLDLPLDDQTKAEPCLELQADHDAIELVLGAYSPDEWPNLRARIAAIASMMMLIEREDAKRDTPLSSHPKAATRIFQLLGHVTEMPFLPAHQKATNAGTDTVDDTDIPSADELAAFQAEVIIPAFFDAVHLARIAGADNISGDLGAADDLFHDIQIAKLGEFSKLRTVGAKQWADLYGVNERIKALHGFGQTNATSTL